MAIKYFCDKCGSEKYNPNELEKLSSSRFIGLHGNVMNTSSFDFCRPCMELVWSDTCKKLGKVPTITNDGKMI